ncbi:MAG TPA: HEAT repeat domain-containing protein [Blastocatellia bacterium]|nr:HEAT repeat domain-containing protein [Blastocatellia bacterium]
MRSRQTPVRTAAAEALGRIARGTKDAVPALLPLLKDLHASVRTAAAEALGNIGAGGKGVVPALIPLLKDQNGPTRGNVRYRPTRVSDTQLNKPGYGEPGEKLIFVAAPNLTPNGQTAESGLLLLK